MRIKFREGMEMYTKTLKRLKLLVEMTKQDNKRFTKEKRG